MLDSKNAHDVAKWFEVSAKRTGDSALAGNAAAMRLANQGETNPEKLRAAAREGRRKFEGRQS